MLDAACIFCKIIRGDIPSKIIKENDTTLVIQDIAPKAPIHYLILTKKHIENISALQPADASVVADTIMMAQELAKTLPAPAAFNLVLNNGAAVGQSVFHWHWHFLAGKRLWSYL